MAFSLILMERLWTQQMVLSPPTSLQAPLDEITVHTNLAALNSNCKALAQVGSKPIPAGVSSKCFTDVRTLLGLAQS